ncbi:MAG: type II toxin-antitoxin system PemK/MazF family toxin [Methanoregula sp.]|nr:type II toxin-antitoxin system PemK/MazF family toxin [Methanoregula sp.]
MGHYTRGDVVIVPLALEERGGAKTRPAVVIGTTAQGNVYVCPVSSKPSSDAPSVPISLDDFSEGGLDLFNESYVLTSQVRRIQNGEVIRKRGRLTEESFASIAIKIPQSLVPDSIREKGTGYLRSKR